MIRSNRPPSLVVNYLLLFGCGLIWGSQYFLNKIALTSFSTSMIAAGRIGIGALTLLTILLAGGERTTPENPKRTFWQCLPDFVLIGLLEATIPCLLVAWAQKQLPSSVTAILIGTVPLLATVMEALFVQGSTISKTKISGIILGFAGVIVLVGKGVFEFSSLTTNTTSHPLLPVLAVLSAALCFSVTMLLIKVRLGPSLGPIHAAQGILLGAALTALPLMIFVTKPWEMSSFHPLLPACLALTLLGIFCGGIVYILYVRLINRAGPSFASTCNYLVPPIGAFIGIFFSGEKMTLNVMLALMLILIALWLSSGRRKQS